MQSTLSIREDNRETSQGKGYHGRRAYKRGRDRGTLKEIMTRKIDTKIDNSQITVVEAKEKEEEEEAVMKRQTRSNINVITGGGMTISIMNATI